MIGYLYIIGLAIAAIAVSTLGAAFSVSGLGRLFASSAFAVMVMASALEFSKFMVAAFLHRTWSHLNIFYRSYLFSAVVLLSLITSMGIFGFLSDSYQNSSSALVENQIKIDALKAEQTRSLTEAARLNQSIDEIPVKLISKKLKVRKEMEPILNELYKKSESIAESIKQLELNVLVVKNKVGPLIYIARTFNQDIDTVVKWLILVFVGVFDPLAICLVIATGEALKMKSEGLLDGGIFYGPEKMKPTHDRVSSVIPSAAIPPTMTAETGAPVAVAPPQQPISPVMVSVASNPITSLPPSPPPQSQPQPQTVVAQQPVGDNVENKIESQVRVNLQREPIQMRFIDEEEIASQEIINHEIPQVKVE